MCYPLHSVDQFRLRLKSRVRCLLRSLLVNVTAVVSALSSSWEFMAATVVLNSFVDAFVASCDVMLIGASRLFKFCTDTFSLMPLLSKRRPIWRRPVWTVPTFTIPATITSPLQTIGVMMRNVDHLRKNIQSISSSSSSSLFVLIASRS